VGSHPRIAGRALSRTARIVPDVPTFAVDDGFTYEIPDGMDVTVGSLVRIPLSGRRVRGWVVATGVEAPERIKPVASVSGDLPVFDADLLGILRWAAMHHVAPLATVLGRSGPPNLPRSRRFGAFAAVDPIGPPPGLTGVVEAARGDGRAVTHYWVGSGPWGDPVGRLVAPVAAAGRSSLVVASTWAEAEEIAARLTGVLGDRVVVASSHLDAAVVTKAWVEAALRPGVVVVGTREVALWPVADLGLAVAVGEGRVGMKEKATPTLNARDLLLKRSTIERFSVVLCGLVPSPEGLARAPEVVRSGPGRAWGQVEIVDRRGEGGLLAPSTGAVLRSAVRDRLRVFVYSERRVAAQRCLRCRTLRRCPECGSSPGEGRSCHRCGAAAVPCPECGHDRFDALGAPLGKVVSEIARIAGEEAVGPAGSGRRIEVGTERDIPPPGSVDLAVVVDGDGPLMAPDLRAAENALRVFARCVAAAGAGRGRRGLIQSADPDHPILEALRKGDPVAAMQDEAERRAAAGLPPGREAIVVEMANGPAGADAALREAVGDRGEVQGPIDRPDDRVRWLLLAPDLGRARVALRPLVAAWREEGATVRVDADPLEM
jgi:primosomal protein N' (replication factor Y)